MDEIALYNYGLTASDVAAHYAMAVEGFVLGDFNYDGDVDVSDLGILATYYGNAGGMTRSQGDANGDGAVDVSDLGILATHYGTSASSSFLASSVPESGVFCLLVFGAATLLLHRRS